MISNPGQAPKNINILFLYPASVEIPPRLSLSAEALSSKGCGTKILSDPSIESMEEFNLVYVHNPHMDFEILEAVAQLSDRGATIVVGLDADYEQMPVEHPDYEKMGLSTLPKAKAYKMALLLADQICVPSNNFATLLQNSGYRVKVIPDGWCKENDLWDKPSANRHTVNFGWIGLPCQLDDATPVRRIISRVLREFPQVQFVIGGDPEIYQMFDSLPESRRLFLPNVSYEDYPYLVSQIDVLLYPLRNNPYNRTLTDRWIMEAGIRRIPWIASPLPSVVAWSAGGLVANTLVDWHTHLRQLVLDHSLRKSLGSSGRLRAEEREMGKLSDFWYQMIWDLWREKLVN